MTALFLQGNARDILKGLPADYFHCCVTSPPYFGLRKYEGGGEIWDGDADCEHDWSVSIHKDTRGVEGTGLNGRDPYKGGEARVDRVSSTCSICDAWRGQLGAEPTPELYIQHLIQIMREVRRVLRPDGVFFLNIGDSWVANRSYQDGCKPLDMILVPEQIALAARTDGWYIRSILIWAKGVSCSDEYNGNPMPESVNGWRWERHKVKVSKSMRAEESSYHSQAFGDSPMGARDGREFADHSKEWQDCPGCPKCEKNDGYILRKGSWRPTDSYERILMLTKTGSYFCDREAVLEPIAQSTIGRGKVSFGGEKGRNYNPSEGDPNFRNGSEQWGREYDYQKSNGSGKRNMRSVLLVNTTPYKGAHFAVFSPKLIEPLIKSATSEKGCCPKCGAPWARVVDKGPTASTTSWLPTCECATQETDPCRVLDPFSGAGTTALVCERLELDSIGIDTSEEYIQLAEARIVEDEQKRIDEQIKQIKREVRLASKNR